MFIKCVCNNCPGHIEFDDSSAGQTVTCPHCGVETVLYVPQGKPADKAPLPAPPTANIPSAATPPKLKNKNSALFVVVGFLFVVVAIGIASFVGTVKNRKPSAQKPDENLQEVKGAMGWNLGEVLPTNFQVNTNDDAFGITYDFNPPADMNIASDMCQLILTEDRRIAAINVTDSENDHFYKDNLKKVLMEKYGLRKSYIGGSMGDSYYFGQANRQAHLNKFNSLIDLEYRDEQLYQLAEQQTESRKSAASKQIQVFPEFSGLILLDNMLVPGAPIRGGLASPLRVATGGAAS